MGAPANLGLMQTEITRELKSVLTGSMPLYDMLNYHMGWLDESGRTQEGAGGKLLRPTLCLLACKVAGGDYHRALPAAAAVELVHNFSLIHDDIEDVSELRRHRPTVWKLWGQPQAINAGDTMYALARLSLHRLKDRGLSEKEMMRVILALDEACLRLCEGQYLDISYEGSVDIDIQDYLEMISLKTAFLFQCSLFVGAVLGTRDEPVIQHLSNFGHRLGMAYQVWDDVMGIWGPVEQTGKLSGEDIRSGKKTLPLIYGLERAREGELSGIFSKQDVTDQDVARITAALERMGARVFAQGMVKQYYHQAIEELEAMGLPPSSVGELAEITTFLARSES